MTLVEFLTYASGEGVNAVVGFVLAFLLELVPGFDGVAPRQKRLLTMGLSFVVPVVATGGLVVLGALTLGSWREVVDALWGALAAGFAAFFGSQAGHATLLPAVSAQRSAGDDDRVGS